MRHFQAQQKQEADRVHGAHGWKGAHKREDTVENKIKFVVYLLPLELPC